MKFTKEMIDSLREAGNEEAAQQMEQANAEQDHRERVASFKTEPAFASKYPRMVAGLKAGEVELPQFSDDSAAEAYLSQQEAFLIKMGAPLPGQQATPPEGKNTPNAGENDGQNQGQNEGINEDDLGRIPGMVPWSDTATQAVLRPTQPGEGASRVTVIVATVEDLMEPEPGQFKRGRARDFQLIKNMEIANRMVGGTQQLRAMRSGHEDPDVFTL